MIELVQGTPEWIAARASSIGSSDAPIVCGESPYRTPFELWTEKVGQPVEPDAAKAQLFRIGKALEPAILSLYEQETGRKVERRPVMLRHPDRPWMTASLDGEAEGRIVEAKWTNARRWQDDEVPPDVLIQVQHQMEVADREVADVAALVGPELRIVEVRRDRDLMKEILILEERFLRCVQDRIPPGIDGSDTTRRALVQLHPEDDGSIVTHDPTIQTTALLLLERKGQLRDLEGEIGGYENTIRYLLENASGYESDEVRISYKRNRDSVRVGWEQVAKAYREILDGLALRGPIEVDGVSFDRNAIAAVESLYSQTIPGPRVLRVTDRRNQG